MIVASDALLELSVVCLYVLSPELLESFDLLPRKIAVEGVSIEGEQHRTTVCRILAAHPHVFEYLFIPKKGMLREGPRLVVGVVDGPHLPAMVGQRPLVMLSQVYMTLLPDFSLHQNVQPISLFSGLGYDLTWEVEVDLHLRVESSGSFLLQVSRSEKTAADYLSDCVTGVCLHLSSNCPLQQPVSTDWQHQKDGFFHSSDLTDLLPSERFLQD